MNLLLSPHSDDEALFASFSIIRHRPHVFICCGSTGDYGDADTRLAESRAAVAILGGDDVTALDVPPCRFEDRPDRFPRVYELADAMRIIDSRLRPTIVFAPSEESSHADHVGVAFAADLAFGKRVIHFHTYDDDYRGAGPTKVRTGLRVPFEPEWLSRKRAALTCYKTQLAHPRACRFFEMDLAEYQE